VNKTDLSVNDDKRIIEPDKINTLAHGYRAGWHGKPTRELTGRQGRSGKVTGEATGWQGWPGKVGQNEQKSSTPCSRLSADV